MTAESQSQSPTTDTSTVHGAYAAAVLALRALGRCLSTAADARYEPSARHRTEASNPTLSIVLDGPRAALSEEVDEAAASLRWAAADLEARAFRVTAALERWAATSDEEPR